ncbi:MAG: foldase protein PrsA [Candidatus Binatia bacterium]
MRNWITLAALSILVARSAGAEVVNRIVASVDGEPITLYELNQYENKQRAMLPNMPIPSGRDALQALITEKLVLKEISIRGIRVRDEDIDRYIAHIKESNRLDDERLNAALQQQGMDLQKYRESVRREIEKVQLINREIRGKVNISPEDVDRYYEAHKTDYEQAGKVKIRHLVLRLEPTAADEITKAVTERITELRKRIVGGEDFATLAKQYSEDNTAADGGDLGELEPAKVLSEFEEPLEKMKEGEVSEPIRTRIGVHLVKLEKRIPVGYRDKAEVSADIKEKLYSEALDERYKRWLLEDIQKHHFVEIKL